MKIVIVDDDRIIRMGLRVLINRLFTTHEIVADFQNGQLAYEYLRGNKVDLVITDIKMPIMRGDELIKITKENIENGPEFIVLSGYDEFNYVRDTMKLGAINYLLKPISDEDLKKIMAEAEEKIKEKGKHSNILNQSIEVLKRDFFKSILFSSLAINKENSLLENIQLSENYIYKMVILQRVKGDDITLINNFIKDILGIYNSIEQVHFNYEENTYIVFYFDNRENISIYSLNEEITEKTNLFIEKERNVYILKETENVWELREQSKNFRRLKNNISNDLRVKQYFLNLSDEGINGFEEDEKTNIIAVKLAKQYIVENYNRNITLKDVADAVFLSQNYLSELFKKEVGEGFYDFLSSYRVNIAKELLITTNLKIYEISENIGYNDPVTFGRVFKKITGYTPNGYRNNKVNFK